MSAYPFEILLAAALVALAVYVQLRLAAFTEGAGKLWTARLVLAAIGLACGYVGAQSYGDGAGRPLAFLIGLGMVHLPAAAILLLKGLRGEGRS